MKAIFQTAFVFFFLMGLSVSANAKAKDNSFCLDCHSEAELTMAKGSKRISLFVDPQKFNRSIHSEIGCIGCHSDLDGTKLPHGKPDKVDCGMCHDAVAKLQHESLHSKAEMKGDPLAPNCKTCHGVHDIVRAKDKNSPVAPLKIPFLCGRCHSEGTKVSRERNIPQHQILENYTESIHGEGLLKKGLTVAANCASCHTAHFILPHTDRRSSIARGNISKTCTNCHAQIEVVHKKIIKGELWEKEISKLPACVDCHQPHKIRKVFYAKGVADEDCMRCHNDKNLKSKSGRTMFVNQNEIQHSTHKTVACSQCHSQVDGTHSKRPCSTITKKVDCAACHAEAGAKFVKSTHGQLVAKNDQNAPTCVECHGTHGVLPRTNADSPIFSTNVPNLCAKCHQEGSKAAIKYTGTEKGVINNYKESIHGKGLKGGLTVSANCINCHTAHSVLPSANPESSVNSKNIAATCGTCHNGVQKIFAKSIHATYDEDPKKPLPHCNDCHSAHKIRRIDIDNFKLSTMETCGRCHVEDAKSYFQTYHGKVSQLGYTKTAKCYDCHGAHDVLKIRNPKSKLSRDNIVDTCKQCHPNATRKFAGYISHGTHHERSKYPELFYAFWGMTILLVSTFAIFGIHTILWFPRALELRREKNKKHKEEQDKKH